MNRIAGMTGPEHFLAGEHALEMAESIDLEGGNALQAARHTRHVAEAQAHFQAAHALAWGALIADGDFEGVSGQWHALLGAGSDGKGDGA